ncbi:MAG: UvrD-helicase domain-containing protein [Pseudomonadales bacterium]|jgi:exodeoxyribonuclease V beta subunit
MSFNPAEIALHGRHLIEASAGTGKTYSIANMFLRFLLEPHPSHNNQQPLTIDQILVVTFTNAATDELRGRIRSKIEQALQYFRGGCCDDEFIKQYSAEGFNVDDAKRVACARLHNALLLVDDAAIFTIHGFAARAMQMFLFETGALANAEVQIGGSDSEARYFDDLVRILALGEHRKFGLYLARQGVNGKKFVASLNELLKRSGVQVLKNSHDAGDVINQYEGERDRLLDERSEIISHDGFFVDEVDKEFVAQKRKLFMGELHLEINSNSMNAIIKRAIAEYQLSGCYDKDINEDCYRKIVESVTNTSNDEVLLFCRVVANILEFKRNEELIKNAGQSVQSALLSLLEERKLELDLAKMNPDDVIRLINSKLEDKEASVLLRQVVTKQYPVCMVDEFQDTDPDQFLMFDRFYQDEDLCGLFAIGDPKQSIYAFRGADVFAYLDVKSRIKEGNVHSLDVNFRSKQGLITCVNALFREVPTLPTFVYTGIEYAPVYSCELPPRAMEPKNLGVYRVGEAEPEPLVFIGNPADDSETFNNTIHEYATDCAERILSLLQGKNCAKIEMKGETQLIRPRDIAVLVSNFVQADAIKNALQAKKIAAVYLAQKDSVFQRCIFASDLFFILRAMDDPYSLFHLKAAFATPLLSHFKINSASLDSLDTDEGFEKAICEFSGYRQCWDEKGVFAALYQLFSKNNLAEVFAAHSDCDRWMTDFRHLGDVLQQQYLLVGSRERLIDWYAEKLSNDSELDEDAKSLRLESDDDLIKIVTLHGCKGLEYPVVFIPFFFNFKETNLTKDVPFYHKEIVDKNNSTREWKAIIDFESDKDLVLSTMQKERMAEDLRLLYVGITRAIYQCYIGISRSHYKKNTNHQLLKSCWGYLLGLNDDEASPGWDSIKNKLRQRMGDSPCDYVDLLASSGDVLISDSDKDINKKMVEVIPKRPSIESFWQITSYSALAYQKETRVGFVSKQDEGLGTDDRAKSLIVEDDARWQQDIRFHLRGGANTGDCLHKIFERMACGETLSDILSYELRMHGLDKPEGKQPEPEVLDAVIQERELSVRAWLQGVLSVPLRNDLPSLQDVFSSAYIFPECEFDFSLGVGENASQLSVINHVLQDVCGASSGIARRDNCQQIHGIMTGAIDLLFIYDKKIYVLDYKSNILGKAPRYYDQSGMQEVMRDSRYDLQYLIYSVAAHRFMRQRLSARYAYDGGEYSFGGVLYTFLRGMGLSDYPDYGVYFVRPTQQQVSALDSAFFGEAIIHG